MSGSARWSWPPHADAPFGRERRTGESEEEQSSQHPLRHLGRGKKWSPPVAAYSSQKRLQPARPRERASDQALGLFRAPWRGHSGFRLVEVVEGTIIQDASGANVGFAALVVGAEVAVDGQVSADFGVRAGRVRILSTPPPPPVSLQGVIDVINADAHTFTVIATNTGLIYTVQASDITVIKDPSGAQVELAALVVGAEVAVEGQPVPGQERVLSASLIQILSPPPPPPPPPPVSLQGAITAVSADTHTFQLSVGDAGTIWVIWVNETTVIQDASGAQVGFAALVVGAQVAVDGQVSSAGSVVASLIRIISTPLPPPPLHLLGGIRSIDPATRTFRVVTADTGTVRLIQVTDGTVLQDPAGLPVGFEALVVGFAVAVEGQLSTDGSVLATKVRILTSTVPTVRLQGVVLSIDSTAHTFQVRATDTGAIRVVQTTEATLFWSLSGIQLASSALAVNELVAVLGDLSPDGSIVASLVVIASTPPS